MREAFKNEMQLYANFMGEIKIRADAIERLLACLRPGFTGTPGTFVEAESAILQVRFVCELIALSALAAHNHMGLTKDMRKAYKAGEVFQLLSTLNKHSFPRAVKIAHPGGKLHFELPTGHLTAKGLADIYGKCGDVLHRGRLKHLIDGTIKNYNLSDVVRWTSSIKQLLNQHIIMLPDSGYVFIATMVSSPEGNVSVALAHAPSGWQLQE